MFGETNQTAVVSISAGNEDAFLGVAEEKGLQALKLGNVSSDALVINDLINIASVKINSKCREAISGYFSR